MPRFAPAQPDLFAEPDAPSSATSPQPENPLAELQTILDTLRQTDTPPWPTLTVAMQEEYRVLGLARLAGDAGAALASSILNETERLLATTD